MFLLGKYNKKKHTVRAYTRQNLEIFNKKYSHLAESSQAVKIPWNTREHTVKNSTNW